MKVFIVDDSEMLRERVISMISDLKDVQIVGQAEVVAGTIDEIHRTRPNVLILDLRLRDGNGLEILDSLQSVQEKPSVIVLTNYPYVQYRDRCTAAGVEFFIDKATEFHKLNTYLEGIQAKESRVN